jgi:hypothetical protein
MHCRMQLLRALVEENEITLHYTHSAFLLNDSSENT